MQLHPQALLLWLESPGLGEAADLCMTSLAGHGVGRKGRGESGVPSHPSESWCLPGPSKGKSLDGTGSLALSGIR